MPLQNILFVCSFNWQRSPTAALLYSLTYNTRSAGVDSGDLTRELVEWADIVVVMEHAHTLKLRKQFPDLYQTKRIACIDVPDDYIDLAGDGLLEILERRLTPFLGAPKKDGLDKIIAKARTERQALEDSWKD